MRLKDKMTVRELIDQLEAFDDDMDVVIGMQQTYGSNFAMEIENCIDDLSNTCNCRWKS